MMETHTVKVTDLNIDGVTYKITSKKDTRKSDNEKTFNHKLKKNEEMQEREIEALSLLFKKRFGVEDMDNRKFYVDFFVRGGNEAKLQFSFDPLYPSDVPPCYTLSAPWVREKSKRDIYKALSDIYSEQFGKCLIYLWIEKIDEALKKETAELKLNPPEEENLKVTPKPRPVVVYQGPKIHEGEPIWDRGSCFSPYLAPVASEEDVKRVIDKIEDCRKVSSAWRNTYAYRFTSKNGKTIEVGEDGGEPKAGRNLLARLVNYDANNVIVYISRRVGGSLLGPDRFKHLNNAADSVLVDCGYKSTSKGNKNAKGGETTLGEENAKGGGGKKDKRAKGKMKK